MPASNKSSMRSDIRRILVIAVVGIVVIGAIVFSISRMKGVAHRGRSLGARLELVAGEVTVKEGDTTSKALSGTPLGTGASVTTAKGSRAFVRTAVGTGAFLRGETEIQLTEPNLALERGEVWLETTRVEQSPSGCKAGAHWITASEAGLSVRRDGESVVVYVSRGLATLSSPGGRVEINAGEQAVAKGNEPPKVSPVAFWDDWTGGLGDTRSARSFAGSGSGRIYGQNPFAASGAPALRLGISRQVVKAVVREGIAETEVDQTFSNPSSQPIEGWYWFTVPAEASVTSFALETDGQLVEGEITERQEASAKYAKAMQTGNEPALLEWVDGRSYRARIYPIPGQGTRRVVLRYVQILPLVEGKQRFVYPLRSEEPVRLDEFALSVDLGSEAPEVTVATSLDALLEEGGRKVTMRRSGYVPRADFQLEMTRKGKVEPLRAWRFGASGDQADYVFVRCLPAIDLAALPPTKGEIVVVVDTSAGGDEGARQLRTSTAETILRSLSSEDKFAVVAIDVAASVLYPKEGLAPATERDIAQALEKLSDHPPAGATDLGSMLEPALARLHGSEQPAIVYVGDGAPTSGEYTPEALAARMRRSLAGSRARLFMVGVGSDARHDLMEHLARSAGGRYLRVANAEEATGQALQLTSLIKTPTITDLQIDLGAGLDQPFSSSAGTLSRGEELLLVARTHHRLPKTAALKGRVAGKDFKADYPLTMQSGITTALVPRFWASEYMRQLLGSGSSPEDNRSKVLELGLDYGLMSPFTSILALESEAAYARQGVKRRKSPLRGVHLTSLESTEQERSLAALFNPSPAAAVAGCSKRAPAADEESADNREGGQGTYAKGEEGSLGNPNSRDTTKRYGVQGPKDNPDPQSGRAEAQREAAEFGMIGLLNPGAAPAATAAPAPQSVTESAPKAPAAADEARKVRAPKREEFGPPPKNAAPPPKPEKDAEKAIPKPSATIAIPKRKPERCSDAAARALPERIVLWGRRLKQAQSAIDLIRQYELARAGCELPDWKDQAALLDLLQKRVNNEEATQVLLSHFAEEKEAQQFIARKLLRRTTDLRVVTTVSRVLFGNAVDWATIDRDLLLVANPEERLERVRKAMLSAPGDPNGDTRLVRILAEAGKTAEALSLGRRLRDRGYMTPRLALSLGDVLVDAKETEEALRTYSEIVEFDPANPATRRLLGDTFLRNRWHQAAYRQYKAVTDTEPKNPLNWLRLAAAAAGTGRIDEALRLEREVAGGEGSPGPNDPRLWARLWSGARLGMLLNDPAPAGGKPALESLQRKIKELQLFSGPGTLALLTWDDLEVSLVLAQTEAGKEKLPGELTDAGPTGLFAVLTSQETWSANSWFVRWKSEPRGRPAQFVVVVLVWNGKTFEVKLQRGALAATDREAKLP